MTSSQHIEIAVPSGSTSGSPPVFPAKVSGTRFIPFNAWSHIEATYKAQTSLLTLYINGTMDASNQVYTGNQVFPSSPYNAVGIANFYPNDNNNQNNAALISRLEVYNYSLTATEVLQVYNTEAVQ